MPRLQLLPLEDRCVPTVVGAGPGGQPVVNVYDQAGALTRGFLAYDASFTGGVRVVEGRFNTDEVTDYVTAPGPGGGPVVRMWDGATGAMLREFLAYDVAFTGGVNLAAGYVGPDNVSSTTGASQIITGAGFGGGPHVKVFDGIFGIQLASFLAYDAAFRGGVTVANVGPSPGDVLGTIVTGTGPGGAPLVRSFRGLSAQPRGGGFNAFDAAFRGGVNVAAYLDGGTQRVVVAPGVGGGPVVRTFFLDGTMESEFLAYGAAFRGGVTLAVRQAVAGGPLSIVTGAGPGGGPHVKAFAATTHQLQHEFLAFDPAFLGGVFVG